MELRKRLDLRVILTAIYISLLMIYILIGLRPAGATGLEVSADLRIPSIGLDTGVATLHIKNNTLEAPDSIAGSLTSDHNKILLIGHSSTVFANLHRINVGDEIDYDYTSYRVVAVDTLAKEQIRMDRLMKSEDWETLVMMTCAGEDLGGGDATHRLIVTAVKEDVAFKN